MNIGGIAYKKVGLNGNSSDHLMELLDLIEGFNRITDYESLLTEIGDAIRSIMKAEISAIMIMDDNQLSVAHATGPATDEACNKTILKGHGFCSWTVEHKLPLIANEIDSENNILGGFLSRHFRARNLICVPLLNAENNVIGVIEAINCLDKPKIEEQDIPLLQAMANHAATAIERQLAEKHEGKEKMEQDLYLTEIHHRVKNDLALISGIVEIESLDIESEDAKQVLKNIQSRIKSMAVVYELLSGEGSYNKAEVGAYFRKLVNGISESLKTPKQSIDIQVNAESVVIDPRKALSCGLILNELLLNSYKHAFDSKESGRISVDLSKTAGQVTISYKDDGNGLPDGFELKQQNSLGFKMIDALVKQLKGSFELCNDGQGAHFVIRFQTNEKALESSNSVLKG